MAIKVGGTTVITNSRVFDQGGTYGLRGNYDDFHPSTIVNNTSSATGFVDMEIPLHKKTLTGNFAYTGIQNTFTGNTSTIIIDRSASGHTLSFANIFVFPTTPTWTDSRWWHVHVTVVAASTYLCTATPFDEPSSSSSSFPNFTFGLASQGWTASGYGTSGNPWASVSVAFQHQTTQNRVAITHTNGNSNSGSTQSTVYATYSGLTGITSCEAQYNVQSQSCTGGNTNPSNGYSYGPLPTNDGYNSGTYYTVPTSGSLLFGWQSVSTSSSSSSTQTSANFASMNPDFRIKIVANEGTFYSTGEAGAQLTATSNWGNVPAF